MKVLLVQDVDKLGSAGEVKEVSGGYGRNYLMPKGFAVLATRGQVKQAEERLATQRKRTDAAAQGCRGAGGADQRPDTALHRARRRAGSAVWLDHQRRYCRKNPGADRGRDRPPQDRSG